MLSPLKKVVLLAVPEPRRAVLTVPDERFEALRELSPEPFPVITWVEEIEI